MPNAFIRRYSVRTEINNSSAAADKELLWAMVQIYCNCSRVIKIPPNQMISFIITEKINFRKRTDYNEKEKKM